MASPARASHGAANAAIRGQSPLQKPPSAAFAALLICGLAGCGGAPSEGDVRSALRSQMEALAGKQAAGTLDAELAKVKLVGCKADDAGGHRCDWTSSMGGGSGRFVKKDGAWVLLGG